MADINIQDIKDKIDKDLKKVQASYDSFEQKTNALIKSVDEDDTSDPDLLVPDEEEIQTFEKESGVFDENLNNAILGLATKQG